MCSFFVFPNRACANIRIKSLICHIPVGIYLLRVNNRNSRTRCLLWTYFTPCSSVSSFNFEKVNAEWDCISRIPSSVLRSSTMFTLRWNELIFYAEDRPFSCYVSWCEREVPFIYSFVFLFLSFFRKYQCKVVKSLMVVEFQFHIG